MNLEIITIATDYAAAHTNTSRLFAREGSVINKTLDGVGTATFVVEVEPGHLIKDDQIVVAREDAAPYTVHFEGMIDAIRVRAINETLVRITLECTSMLGVMREVRARPQVFDSVGDDDIILGTMSEAEGGLSDGVYKLGRFFREVAANSTNTFTQSEDLSDGSYTKTRCTITANDIAALDGSVTADKIVPSVASDTHYVEKSLSGATNDTLQVCSVFLRADEISYARLEILDKAGAVGWVEFNISDGTKFANAGGAAFYARDEGGGWFRCFCIKDIDAGGTTPVFRVYAHNGTSITYAGSGSNGFHAWGFHWDKDVIHPGPYVPTTTVAATVTNVPEIVSPQSYAIAQGQTVLDVILEVARRSGGHIFEQAAVLKYIDEPGADRAAYDLTDGSVTNAWTWSEDFGDSGDAAWTKTRATITDNAAVAPNGTTTADKLVENTDNNTHILVRNIVSPTDDTEQALSFFMRIADARHIKAFGLTKAGTFLGALFLKTGTVTDIDAGVTATMEAVGTAGWYRCKFVYNVGTGVTTPSFQLDLHNGSSTVYTGDGTSGAFIWGLQNETDKGEVGPYVMTEAAAATGSRYRDLETVSDRRDIQNTVTVVGGEQTNGIRLTSSGSDATSVTLYQARDPGLIQASNVFDQTTLDQVRDAILALKANPVESGTVTTYDDGLEVNTTIKISDAAQELYSTAYLISAIRMMVLAPGEHVYGLTLGPTTRRHKLLLERVNASSAVSAAPVTLLGVRFNGTNQFIDFAAVTASFDDLAAAGGLTLTCWISPDVVSGTDVICEKEGGWSLERQGSGIHFIAISSGSDPDWFNNTTLEAGKVYHVSVVWNGGTGASDCTVLVNGAGTSSGGGTGTAASEGNTNFEIGRRSDNSDFWDGWISDIAVWAGTQGVNDLGSILADPRGSATGAVSPVDQLARIRLDDKTDGSTLGTNDVDDAWGAIGTGSGVQNPVQDEATYFPLS